MKVEVNIGLTELPLVYNLPTTYLTITTTTIQINSRTGGIRRDLNIYQCKRLYNIPTTDSLKTLCADKEEYHLLKKQRKVLVKFLLRKDRSINIKIKIDVILINDRIQSFQ